VAAQPGQVLIDQATWSALSEKINTDPMDPILVKGKALPAAVYNLKDLK
jgi:class 3 adenylate cyclase